MHPYPRLRRYFPPEGGSLLYDYLSANLSSAKHNAAKTSPFGVAKELELH